MAYTYEYPRPALTVDNIIIAKDNGAFCTLLIKRKHDPFANKWAFPGGFINENEDLEDAALRELEEETGVRCKNLKQLGTFGKFGRDPRGWIVSVVYYVFLDCLPPKAIAADDAKDAQWFQFDKLPELAFDHQEITDLARQKLGL